MRTVLVGKDETIFCIDGKEAFFMIRRPTVEEISNWLEGSEAPIDAESAEELE